MTDFGGVATGIVSILTVLGAGITWVVRRRDSKKDPIPKQTAALALADQSVALMDRVAQRLEADMAALREESKVEIAAARAEAAEAKGEAKSASKRVSSLEETVETLDTSLTAAVRYIEQLIRYLRGGAHGPEPTVPPELHGLIDPLLRGWGKSPG